MLVYHFYVYITVILAVNAKIGNFIAEKFDVPRIALKEIT